MYLHLLDIGLGHDLELALVLFLRLVEQPVAGLLMECYQSQQTDINIRSQSGRIGKREREKGSSRKVAEMECLDASQRESVILELVIILLLTFVFDLLGLLKGSEMKESCKWVNPERVLPLLPARVQALARIPARAPASA